MQTFWLSYGGGVNSTALAVLLARGELPQYTPWRIVFADTGEERPETYAYIRDHFEPWLAKYGKRLEIVKPNETVLERWFRLRVTGSRQVRDCTKLGKVRPIQHYVKANGGGVQLLGIDAGEAHRMPKAVRPLVDLGIDRDGCIEIIKSEGLPIPEKSGCWCCPFMRASEVMELARNYPEKFQKIIELEELANAARPPLPSGLPRMQWGRRTAKEWYARAMRESAASDDHGLEILPPCGCYDG